jgi:hypothetical protein
VLLCVHTRTSERNVCSTGNVEGCADGGGGAGRGQLILYSGNIFLHLYDCAGGNEDRRQSVLSCGGFSYVVYRQVLLPQPPCCAVRFAQLRGQSRELSKSYANKPTRIS